MNDPRQIYDRLWAEAAAAFARREPHIDPYLSRRTDDRRRSVTLAIRPGPVVRRAVNNFLKQLATVAPGQHFYRPEELHVTVLAVIPGSETWREKIRDLPALRAIIRETLLRQPAFKIAFQGVTASSGAVMIQGFPENDVLENIRAGLRAGFQRQGLAEDVDRRYKISAAHLTVMRFKQASVDWEPFLAKLNESRTTDFGTTHVEQLQLIWSDWYASAETVRMLEEYALRT